MQMKPISAVQLAPEHAPWGVSLRPQDLQSVGTGVAVGLGVGVGVGVGSGVGVGVGVECGIGVHFLNHPDPVHFFVCNAKTCCVLRTKKESKKINKINIFKCWCICV